MGCGYWQVTNQYLPDIITPDRTIGFTIRTIPLGLQRNWTARTFSLGGYINQTVTPFVETAEICTDQGEETFSINSDVAWFQASEGVGGEVTFSYVGQNEPIPNWDWPVHAACDATNTTEACKSLLPKVKARFNALALSGRIPGKILESYGWSIEIPTATGRAFGNSVLLKVDPRHFFQGSLPVSWFRDGDRLDDARANLAPFSLAVEEGFVTSTTEELPIYLGGGQYIPDPVDGKAFPETNGIKVRTYWARGSKVYRVKDLKAMSLEKLQTLPLPWMSKEMNQDKYKDWPHKDNPLQAIPEGSDWPPIPPDNVTNLNPTILANCPDMFQYYALFRSCADNLLNSGTDAVVGNYINLRDQLMHDLRDADGKIDYTIYKPNGAIDGSAEDVPQVDKHYDIDDLRRLNPRNINFQDPFQANRFWLNFRVKVYCWYGFCSDKEYKPWWYDGYFKVNPNYWFERWEQRQFDVTSNANAYKSEMQSLFNELKIQRNLLEFPGFQWGLSRRCDAPIFGGIGSCVEGYGVGMNSGIFRFGTTMYGNLEISSFISKNDYEQIYLPNANKNEYNWSVFIGNPNDAGAPFLNPRAMVMEGSRSPMQLEHEAYWEDWFDKQYRHWVVQEYPIVFQDANGVRFPLGTIKIRRLIHEDYGGGSNWRDDNVHWGWIGNGFPDDNRIVNNDAPNINPDEGDTYDKQTAEYLTDKFNLDERDEMTWSEKSDAMLKIAKYIGVSEGLDLMIKAAYNYRKEAWYLAQKMGLAYAIRKTYTYARALYRVYSEYRQTMDQMREVRDASRRLKRNYRLLKQTYNDIWTYYVHELDYTSLRPTNITKLLPIHLLGRGDYAMWSTVSSLSDMAKGTHLLTLKFEGYSAKAFGAVPQIRFHRNEQQEVSQIIDQNSSDITEQQTNQLKAMRAQNPALNEPDHIWKASRLTEMFTKQVSGSGLWLENGYTRAAHNVLSFVEADANTWVQLGSRTAWQINSLSSIFVDQQSGAVKDNLGEMIRQSAYVARTPVKFQNPAYYSIEKELETASQSVLICGGSPCYGR